LDKEKLEFFRQLLLQEKKKIIEKIEKLKKGDIYVDKDETKDMVDAAADEIDKAFLMRIRDREMKLLNKIEEALQRIENGTYGICESCGCEIEEKRLKARPVATLCISCKEEQEELERKKRYEG